MIYQATLGKSREERILIEDVDVRSSILYPVKLESPMIAFYAIPLLYRSWIKCTLVCVETR